MRFILASALLAALFASSLSHATEIVTRCPATLPDDPQMRLHDLQLYHFGEYQIGGGLETTMSIADRQRRYMVTEMEPENFTTATLHCEYLGNGPGRNRKFVVTIPGLLLRCESLEARSGAGSRDWKLLRFWCTSRIEAPAR